MTLSMIRSPKKCFWQETLEKFRKTKIEFHKSIQKSISKIRGGKHPWKKPSQSIGQQRIQPAKKPSQILQQIDTNFKTTTLAPYGARPIFGVVALKFESIFCWTLLGFLAGWILCWHMLWDCFFH